MRVAVGQNDAAVIATAERRIHVSKVLWGSLKTPSQQMYHEPVGPQKTVGRPWNVRRTRM